MQNDAVGLQGDVGDDDLIRNRDVIGEGVVLSVQQIRVDGGDVVAAGVRAQIGGEDAALVGIGGDYVFDGIQALIGASRNHAARIGVSGGIE